MDLPSFKTNLDPLSGHQNNCPEPLLDTSDLLDTRASGHFELLESRQGTGHSKLLTLSGHNMYFRILLMDIKDTAASSSVNHWWQMHIYIQKKLRFVNNCQNFMNKICQVKKKFRRFFLLFFYVCIFYCIYKNLPIQLSV